MAEETQPKPSEPEVSAGEVAVKEEVAAEPPAEEKKEETLEAAIEVSVEKEGEGVAESASFKEESNLVADLEDPEKKALEDLKKLIQAALVNKEFSPPAPATAPAAAEESEKKESEEKTGEAPKAEEEKTEVAVAEKTEEKTEVAVAEKTEEETAVVAAETDKLPPVKTEEPAPIAEEKAAVDEDDGAKTVEAIEESITPAAPTTAGAVAEVVEEKTPAVAAAEEAEVKSAEVEAAVSPTPPEKVFIWGVPLLGDDDKSDTVLLKFLRARDLKVKDALTMIKNAVIWRKQFGADALAEEDLEVPEFEKAVFYHGIDKEGHPVCYNVLGEFQDKELYAKAFGDEEKRERFLRWRIQFLEKGIRQHLDFTPDAVSTMVQVTDLKNLLGPGKKELKAATRKAVALLQDNYPEFAAKQIFINVPWWYLAYNRMISPFFTQRSKSKFVFAGPSKSSDTLFKYIAPEQVPVQYGGLSKEVDPDFTIADAVTEVTIKPASKHTIELPVTKGDLVWEFRVLGWEVSYGAEFVPTAEDGYTVIVEKARKLIPTDEPYVKNTFKIGEAGKVVLTIGNTSSKKKKLLYRSKVKSAAA